MATISERWTRRSTNVTTHVALGKVSPYSGNGLFVVMMIGLLTVQRRLTTSNRRSACRGPYDR